MSPNALLRHETVLFARSFSDAFSRKRDRLLLAILLVLAAFWLRHSLDTAIDLPPGAQWVALAAGPVSWRWNRVARRRLAWLAEESALAAWAAAPGERLRYLLLAQVPILLPILAAAAAIGPGTAGLAAGAYGAGLAAAQVDPAGLRSRVRRSARKPRSPLSGPRTAFLALLRVQALNSARPGRALLLFAVANALLTFAGSLATRGEAPGPHVAASALPSLLLLGTTARNDAGLVGFLAMAGYRARTVALAVCALPAASLAASSVAVTASGSTAPAAALVTLALLHLGFGLVAVARAWLSPGRTGSKVDLQVQMEAVGLVALGAMLPPLAAVALPARLWSLRRDYRASIGLQP